MSSVMLYDYRVFLPSDNESGIDFVRPVGLYGRQSSIFHPTGTFIDSLLSLYSFNDRPLPISINKPRKSSIIKKSKGFENYDINDDDDNKIFASQNLQSKRKSVHFKSTATLATKTSVGIMTCDETVKTKASPSDSETLDSLPKRRSISKSQLSSSDICQLPVILVPAPAYQRSPLRNCCVWQMKCGYCMSQKSFAGTYGNNIYQMVISNSQPDKPSVQIRCTSCNQVNSCKADIGAGIGKLIPV